MRFGTVCIYIHLYKYKYIYLYTERERIETDNFTYREENINGGDARRLKMEW